MLCVVCTPLPVCVNVIEQALVPDPARLAATAMPLPQGARPLAAVTAPVLNPLLASRGALSHNTAPPSSQAVTHAVGLSSHPVAPLSTNRHIAPPPVNEPTGSGEY